MKCIDNGVTAPKGFKASGVGAGIKTGSTKKDCALIASDLPANVAGVFTKNVMKSPPVVWSKDVCDRGKARAVFVNSGNANACTGEQGANDVRTTVERIAGGLGVESGEVCICSTGVIGVMLPMERIAKGVDACMEELCETGGLDAARAIMTTDTVPKEMAVEVELSSGSVRLGAIAKGAGMIMPNMATMICVITTDASIGSELLQGLLRDAVNVSFNRICIDNDMSTSDTVLCLANGASETAAIAVGSDDCYAFSAALTDLCQGMAKKLVKDGEGATKFVELDVSGAQSDDDAMAIAKAIATSQLCKTAFFGEDPNIGRFACAAGYAGVDFAPSDLCICLDNVQVLKNGLAAQYEEADAAAVMKKADFKIGVKVGNGPGTAVFWTSDLSHDYVSINADYRT